VVVAPTRSSPPKEAIPPRRSSKKAKGKKRGFFRRFWWVFVGVPLLALLGVFGTLLFVYIKLDLPQRLPPIQSTYVYASDGKTLLATLHGAENRTVIGLNQMPDSLQQAVISVEDHGFYQHPAVDPVGIVRAAFADLIQHRVVQGGSTITQQLVKNVYAGNYVQNPDGSSTYETPPRTIGQKVREALLAIKLETKLSKQQILQQYLNTIYFGHGAYGVQAAAKTYFGVDAQDLAVWQSATLAGLITSPSYYDPYVNPKGAILRRNYALDQMANYGYLQSSRADQLKQHKVGVLPNDPSQEQFAPAAHEGHAEYFVEYTKQQLIDRYGSANVFGGGYQVTTSLDPQLQKAAWQAVHSHLPSRSDPEGSLVSIDPRTGQILAMVGGRDFQTSQVNLATTGMPGFAGSGRQAGSAFKAFTLATAMQQHYDLQKYWNGNTPIQIHDPNCAFNGQPWTVSNAEPAGGSYTLEHATWYSVNTVFAQVAVAVGPENIAQTARRMGIGEKLDAVCSITLGTDPVAPLQMANGYATLADDGVRHWATPFADVTNRRGKPVQDLNGSTSVASKGAQVLDRNDARLVTQALTGVVKYGTGTAAAVPGHDVAGKTGTAQSFVDAWFCGYTPQIATCVWVGYPKNDRTSLLGVEGVPEVFGGTIPAAIWQDYMSAALAGRRNIPFPAPTTTAGYTVGPPTPVAPPTTTPPTTTPPTPTRTPKPTPTPTPTPTPSPTPSPSVGPSGPQHRRGG
jgi:penicillin-binding protein 1A